MSGFTPLLFAYVFTAVFLAGIVRGATGFGFSMIMIVLLTLFFPPAQVAPVILFWEVLASIGHLPFVYKQDRRSTGNPSAGLRSAWPSALPSESIAWYPYPWTPCA